MTKEERVRYSAIESDEWFSHLKVGFECEMVVNGEHFPTSNTYESMSKIYSEYSNERTTWANQYHDYDEKISDINGQKYHHFEPDGSISFSEPENFRYNWSHTSKKEFRCGVEMSSKTFMNLPSFFDGVQEAFGFIGQHHGITNSSTGFHITLSGFPTDMNWKKFFNEYSSIRHLKAFGRTNNQYANNRFNKMVQHFYSNSPSVDGMTEVYSSLKAIKDEDSLLDFVNRNYIRDRNFDFHLYWNRHSRKDVMMLEIRIFGGELYHLRFDEIRMGLLDILSGIKRSYQTSWNYRRIIKRYINTVENEDSSIIDQDIIIREFNTDPSGALKRLNKNDIITKILFSSKEIIDCNRFSPWYFSKDHIDAIYREVNRMRVRKQLMKSKIGLLKLEHLKMMRSDPNIKTFKKIRYSEIAEYLFDKLSGKNANPLTLFDVIGICGPINNFINSITILSRQSDENMNKIFINNFIACLDCMDLVSDIDTRAKGFIEREFINQFSNVINIVKRSLSSPHYRYAVGRDDNDQKITVQFTDVSSLLRMLVFYDSRFIPTIKNTKGFKDSSLRYSMKELYEAASNKHRTSKKADIRDEAFLLAKILNDHFIYDQTETPESGKVFSFEHAIRGGIPVHSSPQREVDITEFTDSLISSIEENENPSTHIPVTRQTMSQLEGSISDFSCRSSSVYIPTFNLSNDRMFSSFMETTTEET
jgi:hypothetical protein